MAKHEPWELAQMQALPLKSKIAMTKQRVRAWIDHWDGDVYVSFSGGKDSTVLLDIVRQVDESIPAVFVDTGLEYPEIREFVKTFDNVEWLKPKMNFKKVIETYGYPFISKEVSGTVYEARKWLDKQGITWKALTDRQTDRQTDSIKYAYRIADLMGIDRRGEAKNSKAYQDLKKGIIPSKPIRVEFLLGEGLNPHTGELSPFNKTKWAFLMESPYRVSNQCCNVMKKAPAHNYTKTTGRKPITAQMACESHLRKSNWMMHGCNMFDAKHPISNPMSFWTEQDVLEYIKKYELPICSVYGDIVVDDSRAAEGQLALADISQDVPQPKLKTTGCDRTGCMFCGYGCHLEKGEGRFERMKKTHPKTYDWIMKPWDEGGLDYKNVIDWLNENGNLNIKY